MHKGVSNAPRRRLAVLWRVKPGLEQLPVAVAGGCEQRSQYAVRRGSSPRSTCACANNASATVESPGERP